MNKDDLRMRNDNIFGTVHQYFQSELEEYGEKKKEEARIEGRREVDIKVAKNMIKLNYPLKEIAEITKLDINTIKQLKGK